MSTNVNNQQEASRSSDEMSRTQSKGSSDVEKRAEPNAFPAGLTGENFGAHNAGVSQVEAFNKVLWQSGRKGKILLWALVVSIMLTMFVYALDGAVTSKFFSIMAASYFGKHADIATVSVASSIISAVSKPFIGKMADITSRPTTYVIVLVFYVIGFIIAASASTFPAYVAGICLSTIGKSGLDILADIVVGDLTSLEWRGFVSALLSTPSIILTPISGFIASGLEDTWRWGFGIFTIMAPACLIPAIVILYTIQHRGKKLGAVTMASNRTERKGGELPGDRSYLQIFWQGIIDIDLFGLILLGFAFALILLPFNLRSSAKGGWKNPSIIAMLVVGVVLLIAYALYESFVAPKPMMTRRIVYNRAFLCAVFVDIFTQMSSFVKATYFSSFVYVTKDWSAYVLIIFLGIVTMGLCILGPTAGILQRITHRYKTMTVLGTLGKVVGYGILINAGSNTMTYSTGRLVASQLITCLGAFSVVGSRVASQASVPHEDLASVISLLSLWSTLGTAIGGAIAGGIWSGEMLDHLFKELPDVPEATVRKLYGSIRTVRVLYPIDSPVRQGVIRAYAQVNGHIAITALCLAVLPVFATMCFPDFYLGKQHNVVTETALDGEKVDVPHYQKKEQEQSENKKWYIRLRDLYRKDL
ncbi:unnamed protein product [Parajaminaea phylloscopi]